MWYVSNLVPRSHSVLHLAVGDLGTRLVFIIAYLPLFLVILDTVIIIQLNRRISHVPMH